MLKDEIEKYEKLGYQCEKFSFENREGVVVFPFVARKENPWIWRPEFFGAFEQADQELLKQLLDYPQFQEQFFRNAEDTPVTRFIKNLLHP